MDFKKNKNYCYLDYNATTPLLPDIAIKMLEISNAPLNSSAIHCYGREAKHILDNARKCISELINIQHTHALIFTSSATESNNLAIKGLASTHKIITAPSEHLSVLSICDNHLIAVNNMGLVDLDNLENICKAQNTPFLISVMMANNETGIIQPVKEIAEIVHKYNGLFHTDASQALGKIALDVDDLNIDLMSISSHKIGGPLGVGGLIVRKSLDISPMINGGGQEFGYRAGTQNIASIHGFAAACKIVMQRRDEYFRRTKRLISLLEDKIKALSKNTVIFASDAERISNTSSFTMPGVLSETQVMHFDIDGFAVSAGSACSSGKIAAPYVQMSMGFDADIARTALRVSIGFETIIDEIDAFFESWKKLYIKTCK